MLASKHLLGLEQTSQDDIEMILHTAAAMKARLAAGEKKMNTLRGRAVVTLFYEPSTRTRTSFELAGKYLGADVVNIAVASSSAQKGETLKDTARNLAAMSIDALVVRHAMAGVPRFLAGCLPCTVINAGDGMHEHPTQALLDIFTIREKMGDVRGRKVAIIGDIAHSRVARSNIWGLTKLGAKVVVAGPSTLLPPEIEQLGVQCTTDIRDAARGASVINVLRLQLERQQKGLFPSTGEYTEFFGVDERVLAEAEADALLLHPGPMNRGVEIAATAADGRHSAITEQVTNGVAVRMALLKLLLGGEGA